MSMSKSNKKKSSIPQVRVAKMLFVLSLSSFVLSSPDHIFRLYFFLSGITNIPYDLSLASLVFKQEEIESRSLEEAGSLYCLCKNKFGPVSYIWYDKLHQTPFD
jgi:hypothetical protein